MFAEVMLDEPLVQREQKVDRDCSCKANGQLLGGRRSSFVSKDGTMWSWGVALARQAIANARKQAIEEAHARRCTAIAAEKELVKERIHSALKVEEMERRIRTSSNLMPDSNALKGLRPESVCQSDSSGDESDSEANVGTTIR